MKSRFETVRKMGRAFLEGMKGEPTGGSSGPEERFVMKPGEVRIVKGGGARIDRQPGEPRDAG